MKAIIYVVNYETTAYTRHYGPVYIFLFMRAHLNVS